MHLKLSVLAMFMAVYLTTSTRAMSFATPTFADNSCAAKCHKTNTNEENMNGKCRCDDSCARSIHDSLKDPELPPCCDDYLQFCEKSCASKCGQEYSPFFPCQCHSGCNVTNGTEPAEHCCEDYKLRCIEGVMPTEPPEPVQVGPRNLDVVAPPRRMEVGDSHLQGKVIKCEDGVKFEGCVMDPCDFPCKKFPNATCRAEECGECKAIYSHKEGGEAIECFGPEHRCEGGQLKYDCEGLDLCKGLRCTGFPRAICVPNNCGGCYFDFVDDKNNIVDISTCEIEI